MHVSHVSALLGGLLAVAAMPAVAQSRDCPYQRELAARIPLSPGTPLRVTAGAGSLVVRGVQGLREARVQGTVCAASSDLAQQASIRADREAGTAVVETSIPELHRFFSGDTFVRIDLILEVPAGTAATVNDGSGSAHLIGLGELEVHDGSGELLIEDANGGVEVHDGSGSIEIRGARGSIQVHDGSGDVIVQDVDGDVMIYDGSGGIEVDGARSLVVAEDGSGSVGYTNVSGRVDVPRRRRRG
jgi:hypothetical protein